MRRKLLNRAQEMWLFKNYPYKSNAELAEELNKMIIAENEKVLGECIEELDNSKRKRDREKLTRRILYLRNFKGVDLVYIRKKAVEMGCCKSPMCISKINRKKAENTYWSKIMSQAVYITSPYEWFRTFKLQDEKVAKLENEKKYKMMRKSMWNWNHEEGNRKGIVLVPRWNQDLLAVKVEAKPIYK